MQINQDNNKYILAWFLGAGFFSLIIMLMFFGVKDEAKEIVFTLLGSFGTAFGMAMSYFFGSSEGSKEKTKLLKGE